nr:hypothetical protein SYMBAF_190004 [Serratia symbiotica]
MIATTLREADFIDLYLGEDYAEIKGMVGATGFLVPVPAPLMDDVRQLTSAAQISTGCRT